MGAPPTVSQGLEPEELEQLEQDRAFYKLADALHEQVVPKERKPPSALYHFTSAKGLLGILGDQGRKQAIIRCTHFMHTNDASEAVHAYAFVHQVARELLAHEQNATHKDILEYAMEVYELGGTPNHTPYLACFSKKHDRLSQWRLYADSGRGYCLGIKPARQRLLIGDDANATLAARWIKVLYKPPEIKALIRKTFETAFQVEREMSEFKSEATRIGLANMALANAFDVIACAVKHESFWEEEEWRLVILAKTKAQIMFHSDRGLVPYVDVPLDSEGRTAWLKSVYIGPVPNRKGAEEATRLLLKSRGYREKLVSRFETSYTP